MVNLLKNQRNISKLIYIITSRKIGNYTSEICICLPLSTKRNRRKFTLNSNECRTYISWANISRGDALELLPLWEQLSFLDVKKILRCFSIRMPRHWVALTRTLTFHKNHLDSLLKFSSQIIAWSRIKFSNLLSKHF